MDWLFKVNQAHGEFTPAPPRANRYLPHPGSRVKKHPKAHSQNPTAAPRAHPVSSKTRPAPPIPPGHAHPSPCYRWHDPIRIRLYPARTRSKKGVPFPVLLRLRPEDPQHRRAVRHPCSFPHYPASQPAGKESTLASIAERRHRLQMRNRLTLSFPHCEPYPRYTCDCGHIASLSQHLLSLSSTHLAHFWGTVTKHVYQARFGNKEMGC